MGVIFLVLFLVILTIPKALNNTYVNIAQFTKFGYLFVDKDLEQSFRFIRDNTDKGSLILADPTFDYDRYSTFITAFAQRPMFVSGEKILKNHNVDISKRQFIRDNVFKGISFELIARDLLSNKIDYIFLWERDDNFAKKYEDFTDVSFNKSRVKILKISKSRLKDFVKTKLNY